MQLSLFEKSDKKLEFMMYECDSNYETLLKNGTNFIKNSFWKELTKQEVLEKLASSDKNKKHLYAWSIYYQENNRYWELIIADGGVPMSGGSTGGFKDVKRYIDSQEWEDL